MPDPNKKISTLQFSPFDIKTVLCEDAERDKHCEKTIKLGEAAITQETGKGCKSPTVNRQATLNKKPCPSGTACHLARPDRSTDPASRIDKTKPGCTNFEACEEDEQTEVRRLESGCIDYEDCQDYAKEEKRWLKAKKEEEKQKRKKQLAQERAEKNPKCGHCTDA